MLGLPVAGMVLLYIRRKKLDEPNEMRYFLVLYQGLRRNRFYWEFCNILRKIFIVMINVFLAERVYIKIGLSLALIVTFQRM